MWAPAHPYRLLIVDDDRGFRETVRMIFEPHFQTIEAESGEEAVELVEHAPIDIALLDMHMHRLDGLQTLELLRRFNNVAPYILVTADATDDLRRTARAVDVYEVLKKPVTKRELVEVVNNALVHVYDDPGRLADLN